MGITNKKTQKRRAKKMTLKQTFRAYMDGKTKLTTGQKVGIVMMVWVLAGVAGWICEVVTTLVGTGHFYMHGGNLLPWINIYAFGAMVIMMIAMKLKRYPWAVFALSALLNGTLECLAGWLVYTIGNGTRYWYYNHGVWAIGNINGFVCLLSATAFGVAALLLTYAVLPWCIYVAQRSSQKVFLAVVGTMFALVMVDELTNLTLKNLGQPTAMDLYESLGLEYRVY